jgi:hypothetical protein
MGPGFHPNEPGHGLGVGLIIVLVALMAAGVQLESSGHSQWAQLCAGLHALVLGGAMVAAYRWGYRSFFLRWLLFVTWLRPSFGRVTPLMLGGVIVAFGVMALVNVFIGLLW